MLKPKLTLLSKSVLVIIFFLILKSRLAYSEITSNELNFNSSILMAKEQFKTNSGLSNGATQTHQALILNLEYFRPIYDQLSLGAFILAGSGTDETCDLSLNSGVPTPQQCKKRHYNEYSFGPTFKYKYKSFFFQASYMGLAIRKDNTYSESFNGQSYLLRAHPIKAWIFSPGATISILENLNLLIKIEYRYLYYSRLGETELTNDLLFGNQNLRFQIGLSYIF